MPEYKVVEVEGKKYIEMSDSGHPLAVDGDTVYPIDALSANEKVRKANEEAKKYRQEAREAKQLAEQYKPLAEQEIDPSKALEAVQAVASLDQEKQVEIEKLKKSLNQTWEQKLNEVQEKAQQLEQKLYKETVLAKFATSPVAKKLIIPPDIAAEYFGKHFTPDGTAMDADGNPIYSKEKPGEPASFDEALETLISQRPDKDFLLKGSTQSGSGGHAGGSGGEPTKDMTPVDRIKAGLEARQ
jgi:hypothetical protein